MRSRSSPDHLATRQAGPACFINFHGIGAPGRDLPQDERPYWISRDFFEAIIEFAAGEGQHLRFTFDDGNDSDYTIAAPLLEDYGMKAQFFVLAGRLDSPGSLSSQQVHHLRSRGMEIGTQGFDHVPWPKLNEAGRQREWVEARARIAAAAGKDVTTASAPYGTYGAREVSALKKLGYRHLYTSDHGHADPGAFVIARTSVTSRMTMADIVRIAHDDFTAARRLRRQLGIAKKRWL